MATVSETVDVKVGGGDMQLFTYRSGADGLGGGGKRPGLVVIQEVFGVNDHLKDVAGRFAAEGYVVAVPELFHRSGRGVVVPYDQLQVGFEHRAKMTLEDMAADVSAAVDYLKGDPGVDGAHIGIVGFCFGGMVSYLAAARVSGLSAAAVFYGGGILPRLDAGPDAPRLLDATADAIAVPIISFWGDEDRGIPVAQVEEIVSTLRAKGKDIESTIYPGAGHGFFSDDRDVYNEAAAKDSWPKTLAFFAKHLKG